MSSEFLLRQRTGFFALFVIFCVFLTAHLRLDYYPDTYYGDEEIPIAVINNMEQNHSLDTNWARGIWRKPEDRWAYGYNQYNFSSYNSTQYYLNQLFQVKDNNINPAIFNRISSLAFQIAALVIICYSIKFLIGIYGAITAGLFFTLNPLLVVDAHYARPESFLIFITTLAIFYHLFAIKQKKQCYFWVSAFIWGIACACKFSMLPIAGLCALHFFIRNLRQNKKVLLLPAWLLIFLSGAFLLAPYLFINIDQLAHGVLVLFKQYFNAESANVVSFDRSDLLLPKYLLGYFGAAFWLAITLSPLHSNRFLKCLSVFLLAITFFYIIIFSLLSFFNESNLSHLAVFWCLLLAASIETCIARARMKTKYIHVFFIVINMAILTTPALCSFKIKNEVYNPIALQKTQNIVDVAEKNLLDTHSGTEIIDISKNPTLINQTTNQQAIIKIPWVNRNELYKFVQMLGDQHYILVAEVNLPLSELPHSQLQSIHFPASYRYYQRIPSSTGE